MVVKFKQSPRAAGLLKRGACCVLAASLCFVGPGAYGLTAWADPAGTGNDGGADASDAAKTVNFGADVLTTPADGWTASEGNYLYFGSFQNAPTKYRVLANADGKLLIDSDQILVGAPFTADSSATDRDKYKNSDVASYLGQGKIAPTGSPVNESLFSSVELQEVAGTSLSEISTAYEAGDYGLKYQDLCDSSASVKAFLLSAQEADNLYASATDRAKTSTDDADVTSWWLRSTVDPDTLGASGYDGTVNKDGDLWFLESYASATVGIAPAAYLNTGNVLFTTDNSFDKTQALAKPADTETQTWKATLRGDDLQIQLEQGTIDDDGTVTVPYTLTGDTATQISVVVASDDQFISASGDAAELLYYGKVAEGTAGTGSFTFSLPEDLPEGYAIYAVAEDVNEASYTDYASAPIKISWDYTVSFDTNGGSAVNPMTVRKGDAPGAAPETEPVRDGYTFDGWYADKGFTQKFDFEAPLDRNVTVYAKWTENSAWERLAGNTAIGTMKQIVNEGWDASEFAIVATNKSYHDALAASGLAGLLEAPVLLTAQDSLTPATKTLIQEKGVKNVVVVGGTEAVSDAVLNQIKAIDGVSAERVWGNTAIGTANKIYDYGTTLVANGAISEGWGKDAVVATTSSYHDAASIAPYAYAQHAPVFLVGGTLSDGTAKRVVDASAFDRTLVIGGTAAVSADVEKQLVKPTRLGGGTAYGTCKKVADFSLANGMNAQHMGVATGRSYQDAIVGAALCGKNNSILVLADDGNSNNVGSVVAAHKDALAENCYVFGGEQAVSSAVYSAILVASE